ncbi:alpha/beta hydrolase [Cellulomonas hominis]|uniref:Alpha/beta hydrolase n=1 Tax=Cellulomonas hominis TaxID=156981 RepID=A0A7Z8K0U2_9CELL|nr:alpha/beta hydrolase [Cellulomonas hominis]TKR26607.1 alpha/beta hydrolase [Cellulomonas hominis]
MRTTRHRPRTLLRRTALAVALTLLALPLAGAGYEAWSARGAADRYPPPGRLVDVGGHALHLDVRGTGSPVVVLEAGSGETSLGWESVADALAQRTTVVAYDRAGYAWSEPSAEPRTGEAVVADLRAALDAAGLAGPYVVVGHSMGGLFARLLAERAPEDVAGLVLVDARPEDDARETADVLAAEGRPADPPAWALGALQRTGVLRLFADQLLAGMVDPAEQDRFLDVVATPAFFAARQEEADLIGSTEDAVRGQDLGDLPVRVVARGEPQDYAAAGISARGGAELERIWQDGQRRMLGLSSRAALVVAEGSGHLVPRDRPDVVVDQVLEVLTEIGADRGARSAWTAGRG